MATLDDGTLTVADWLEAADGWRFDGIAGLLKWREAFLDYLWLDIGAGAKEEAEDSFVRVFELTGLLALAGVE